MFTPSKDGSSDIPLTVTCRRDIVLDGENPTLVFVYGAYGTHFKPEWYVIHVQIESYSTDTSSTTAGCSRINEVAPLLKRGFVIAVAHVRGGGERGNKW